MATRPNIYKNKKKYYRKDKHKNKLLKNVTNNNNKQTSNVEFNTTS